MKITLQFNESAKLHELFTPNYVHAAFVVPAGPQLPTDWYRLHPTEGRLSVPRRFATMAELRMMFAEAVEAASNRTARSSDAQVP